MAATTLKAIIDRFQAVCEAAPLSLTATVQPFTFETQPAPTLADRYWVEDDGLSQTASVSNNVAVRLDRLNVWLARRHTTDGQTAVETLEADLVTLERYILADGPANSYTATVDGRQIGKSDGIEVLVASLSFLVDYDYSLATT